VGPLVYRSWTAAWGGAMFEHLAAWLPRCGADVLCLQEVTRTPGLGGWTTFSDGERQLPQRANLFDDVRQAFPRHQAHFLASDAGPVATEDDGVRQQEFGLAMYIDERLPLIGQTARFVHGAFVDHQQWAITDRPRLAHAARLVDRTANRTVTVVHLHGLRDPEGKHDTPARRAQAEHLVRLIEQTRHPDDLTVVCGDLNLLPGSETFDLLAAVGLVDLVGTVDTRTSRYTKSVRHANYLLVSDVTAVKHFDAPGTPEVSDHRPLILDI